MNYNLLAARLRLKSHTTGNLVLHPGPFDVDEEITSKRKNHSFLPQKIKYILPKHYTKRYTHQK